MDKLTSAVTVKFAPDDADDLHALASSVASVKRIRKTGDDRGIQINRAAGGHRRGGDSCPSPHARPYRRRGARQECAVTTSPFNCCPTS